MEHLDYQLQWPKDNLFIRCFVHEPLYYRYHWHPDFYELNILLRGSQDFCPGTNILSADDVLLIEPGTGHASFGQLPGTTALVLQFNAAAFKPFVKKGCRLHFSNCHSCEDTRDREEYRLIRFYAAHVLDAARTPGPYSQLRAKAAMEMLLVTLCTRFLPEQVETISEQDEQQQEVIHRLTEYMEKNYARKLTLEDLAQVAQYNRTYISTLFKNTVGINFYDYLTRIRFEHALTDLATTGNTLTQIALGNGFSDLKSFNKYFRSIMDRTPAQYRSQLGPEPVRQRQDNRVFIPKDDPIILAILRKYMEFPSFSSNSG